MSDKQDQQPLIRVVDDDQDFLDGLRFLLDAQGWRTAGYRSAQAFLTADAPSVPGCLVLDIRMPGMSGIELQEEIKRRGIDLPIIILTGHADIDSAVRTLKMGAVDFLQKPVSPQAFLESVEEAVKLSLEQRLGGLDYKSLCEVLEGFSAREKQLAALLVQGLVNSAIAERLSLSLKTVQNYRNTIYRKLRVHNTEGLLRVLGRLSESERRAFLRIS